MQRRGINFSTSGNAQNIPQTSDSTRNVFNYAANTGYNQPQNVSTFTPVNTVGNVGNIVYGGNFVQDQSRKHIDANNAYGTTVAGYAISAPQNVASGQNYGYGSNVGIRKNEIANYTTSTSVGYQPSTTIVGGSVYQPVPTGHIPTVHTGPSSFAIKPSNVSFVNTSPAVYTSSIVQPAVVQQTYVAPQPVRAVQVQGANQWAQDELERPKYSKLYNNSAEYYRNLAPQEDPTVKKTCCSPFCWVLWGLLGLLAMVFGILCGLGVFCGGMNLGLPSLNAPNINLPLIGTPDIGKPDITQPDTTKPNNTANVGNTTVSNTTWADSTKFDNTSNVGNTTVTNFGTTKVDNAASVNKNTTTISNNTTTGNTTKVDSDTSAVIEPDEVAPFSSSSPVKNIPNNQVATSQNSIDPI